MGVLDAIRLAPDPLPIADEHQEIDHDAAGGGARVLPGIAALVEACADAADALLRAGRDWATPRVALRVAGRRWRDTSRRPDLPVTLSPRPLPAPGAHAGGTVVTEVRPGGPCRTIWAREWPITDVGGRNFWGGRTYVPRTGARLARRPRGPAHVSVHGRGDGGFTETLLWAGPDGTVIMREERTVSARPLPRLLGPRLRLHADQPHRRPLKISSSAIKGRPGAGYGGFFWRAPGCATGRDVFTATARGEAGTHGVTDPWLALTAATPRDDGEAAWSLVFVQAIVQAEETPEPWFVRISDYPGVGVALAWERALVVEDTLARRIVTVIADGRLTRARAAGLAAEALS